MKIKKETFELLVDDNGSKDKTKSFCAWEF